MAARLLPAILAVLRGVPIFGVRVPARGVPQKFAYLIGNALADAVEHVLIAGGHFGARQSQEPFNLLAAMALWAGLRIDPAELHLEILVVAARPQHKP